MQEDEKKKKNRFIIIIIFCLLFLGVGGFLIKKAVSGGQSAEELLVSGEEYLENKDYENAITKFNKVIDKDSTNERAYLASAQAYTKLDKLSEAVDVLQKGVKEIPSSTKLASELDKAIYEKEREPLAKTAKSILAEIAALAKADNYEGAFDLMQTDEYDNVIALAVQLKYPYILETASGKIGVYEVDSPLYNNHMLYFGDYSEDDVRDGAGTWFAYSDEICYRGVSAWVGGKPNGYAEVKLWFSTELTDKQWSLFKGTVIDGVWDGDATYLIENEDKTITTYNIGFDAGKYRVLYTRDYSGGKRYIVSESVGNANMRLVLVDGTVDDIHGFIGFGKLGYSGS